jgi:predicted MPP superfamily phosphohydrolase
LKVQVNRRQFLKAFGQVVATYAVTGFGLDQYGKNVEAERLSVEHVQIPLKNLEPALEGFKIVHMSDIHLHPFTQIEFIREAIALANSLQPDVIALTGDYTTDGVDSIFELAPALARLNAKYGVFASMGNHEAWADPAVIRASLEEVGLSVLVNEGVALDVGGGTIYLAGVDALWDGKPDLKAALEKSPPGVPVVLLAHEQDFADESALDGRVSLQLSGHSHGGQICLPGLGPIVSGPYAQKYPKGLYNVNGPALSRSNGPVLSRTGCPKPNGTWVYTTRGIGTGPIPHRINCPPEVTEIALVGA